MDLSRRELLFGLAAAPLVGCGRRTPAWKADGKRALDAATTQLWSVQDDRGAWPSARYGLMRSGQSTTAFVLASLVQAAPGTPLVAERASAALSWLLGQHEEGAIGFRSEPPDYPVYATSLTAWSLATLRPAGWEEAVAPLLGWLEGQQCAVGFEGHPAEGGFPFGAREPVKPEPALHVDLSMTRRALEAFAAAGRGAEDPVMVRGRAFVERSQTANGAFLYSVGEAALNKGRRDEAGAPEGYGSATTDGVLALIACGEGEGEAARRALEWLHREHRVDQNPGIVGGPSEPFAVAMKWMYRAGAAAVFRRMGGPEGWEQGMVEAVVGEQQGDGGFVSVEALQKEDDPLIATGFAVGALTEALAGA